ncbi:DNA mismatch repair endonuclease MutL [Spirobacillus cienkowskii]|uniref:DNA mismatch repair endonuclease MutL n=1 Tax=Spirobacillus cienkowskii TaxID=495820 RepID=UPI0030CBCA92
MEQIEIKKLPENLINQIKAGEVIERPYNVVKELVENAIDAAANQIYIELLDGGKKLIRITDNGIGIAPNQLLVALERHATSKITQFSDLESLSSFGFRGEALPSIASISDFSIKSKPRQLEKGKEIKLHFGNTMTENEIPMNTGTIIQINNIFENVPVRLKFLKSTATEFAHIHDFLTAIALANHKISFKFLHNSREVFNYTQKNSVLERFQEVVGITESKNFCEINFQRGSFCLQGFVGLPQIAKQTPSHFMTFVNGRYVKDKVIRSGILQAYQGLILKGLLAPAIIFVTVDPAWIDVNAHPSKTEIRFFDPLAIQELIYLGIEHNLKQEIQKKAVAPSIDKKVFTENYGMTFSPSLSKLSQSVFTPKETNNYTKTAILIPKFEEKSLGTQVAKLKQNLQYNTKPTFETILPTGSPNIFESAKLLGQYANCYILIELNSELWIIDQHAFHERILFEEILTTHLKQKIVKQDLITPMIIPLNKVISTIILEHEKQISSLGFNFEVLQNGNIAIHSFPNLLQLNKVTETFDEIIARIIAIHGLPQSEVHPILEKAASLTKGIQNEFLRSPTELGEKEVYHMLFATMACHSAVRAGDPLNDELIKRLLNRAKDVDFFAHCPHGRPVIRKFTNKDIASWFQRI